METEKETINRINRELNKYLPAKYRQSNEANVVLKNISKAYPGQKITKQLIQTEVNLFYNT